MSNVQNRRQDMRIKVKAKVKLSHPSVGQVLLESGDISDSGVFLYTGEITPPEVGERVTIQMTGMPMEAPIVTMKVVRHISEGIGLQFVLVGDE